MRYKRAAPHPGRGALSLCPEPRAVPAARE